VSGDPQDRAVLLLQRTRDLLLECRAVAEHLAAATDKASASESAERIAYGVLVAALEEGLVKHAGARHDRAQPLQRAGWDARR
jgi:hypothetical protein